MLLAMALHFLKLAKGLFIYEVYAIVHQMMSQNLVKLVDKQ